MLAHSYTGRSLEQRRETQGQVLFSEDLGPSSPTKNGARYIPNFSCLLCPFIFSVKILEFNRTVDFLYICTFCILVTLSPDVRYWGILYLCTEMSYVGGEQKMATPYLLDKTLVLKVLEVLYVLKMNCTHKL